MMNFPQFESDYKPAPIPGDLMGHVKDTENVRVAEKKYGRPLVGYSAKWLILPTSVRVQVWDNNQWCGVFPLTADDVEYHMVCRNCGGKEFYMNEQGTCVSCKTRFFEDKQ